ncbi:MAG TPA: phosphohistidine phosphatase SixA [Blastocatellia bacterium]|nr:phosphohistidine phosphatase SixA [Blastocatellia bacterium]
MDLYVIRHAIAQPLGRKNDFTEEKRALTPEGRDRMREAAKGLRALGVTVDLILTSPLARAVQTAEVVAGVLGMKEKEVERTNNLAPGSSHVKLFGEIKKRNGVESIALVGHQPELGQLISRIISGSVDLSIQLKKGGVACVNVTETVPVLRGSLAWLLAPAQLRALARGSQS